MLRLHDDKLMQSRKRLRMDTESYINDSYTSLRNCIYLFNTFIYFIRGDTTFSLLGSAGSWCSFIIASLMVTLISYILIEDMIYNRALVDKQLKVAMIAALCCVAPFLCE
jgi:hypothetical protein